jgi:aldehyde dehydrogenase (NAD+)
MPKTENTETQPDTLTFWSGIFEKQQQNRQQLKNSTAKQRIGKLESIKNWILNHEAQITAALQADFAKHPTETLISEILVVIGEINHFCEQLPNFMAPQRVGTTATMLTTSAWVQHEPKGCALVIAPWNYPFNLAVKPVVQAIAAGNTVILKPSELTPHTSALLSTMFDQLFDTSEVAVAEGGVELSQALLKLPFDHVFFTGSPAVGKLVMAAAAQNLSSVTLELGGKSPVIIDQTANIAKFTQAVAWGKFFNAGQTCIAPDYLLVQKSLMPQVLEQLKIHIHKMYGTGNEVVMANPDYARIISSRHFERLKAMLQNTQIWLGGASDTSTNYIEPTIVINPEASSKLMQEEIFGPILPVVAYDTLDDAIAIINSKEKPLALYIGSKSNKNIGHILANTSSGAAVVNDTMLHYSHTKLPFGGVNNSGIGKSGGQYGFLEFSNQKAVLKQRLSLNNLLYPPYTKKIDSLVHLLIKYFS